MADGGVLVTHSGRQHSHQLAMALDRAGLLRAYWTGVPLDRPAWVPALFWGRYVHYDPVHLPGERKRVCMVGILTKKVADRLLPEPRAIVWSHRADYAFDRWAAWRLGRMRSNPPAAVVAYENAALQTFAQARKMGVTTILDAAALHHTGQDAGCDFIESGRAHARITRHKDAELRLADHVVTVSEWSRGSYVRAGISPDIVTAVPLGADLDRFRVREGARRSDGSLRILFAGAAAHHKGFDLLVDAAAGLRDRGAPFEVTVVGRDPEGWSHRTPSDFHWVGQVDQERLAELYASADVLVLPSRHDALPLVVLEGLACGLPVIVSDRVGSKEAVQEGRNGWIVPADDAAALRDRLFWCADHRAELHGMQEAALCSAREYGWDAYGERITALIGRLAGGAGWGNG